MKASEGSARDPSKRTQQPISFRCTSSIASTASTTLKHDAPAGETNAERQMFTGSHQARKGGEKNRKKNNQNKNKKGIK